MQFPLYPRPWTCLKEFLLFYMCQLSALHIVILFIITTVGSTYKNIYTQPKTYNYKGTHIQHNIQILTNKILKPKVHKTIYAN